MIQRDSEHWRKFCSITPAVQGKVGISPAEYLAKAKISNIGASDEQQTRDIVTQSCRAAGSDPWMSFVRIMAWGGQNAGPWGPRALDAMIRQKSKIVELMIATRDARSAGEAFDIWYEGDIKYLGPAFFTKVLFFELGHHFDCFIFDQWTARSFYLLTGAAGDKSVLNKGGNGRYKREVYLEFCQFVTQIPDAIPDAEPANW